jgi:serpin B
MTSRAGSWWLPALTVALSGGAGACSGDGGDGDPPPPIEQARSQLTREAAPQVAAADRKGLAEGNAAFAMALYQHVQADNPNLVFSPASISTALAMAFAGARGQTETEMAAALRFGLPQARLHPALNELTAALASRGEGKKGADGQPFRLKIVNTTWAQKDFDFLPGYLDVLAVSYGAGVNLLDFRAAFEPSRLIINRWVADQTEQRIKDLLPMGSITDETRLVLTNAVYFNAAWKSPFIRKTEDAAFTRADGSKVQVPMMSHKDQFRAGVVSGLATAVALPYDDDRLSMLLVLPDPGKLAALESQLGSTGLGPIDAALVDQVVVLDMPRFKFETPLGLNDALKALGMPLAFDRDRADFSGISGVPLYIAAVLHKAFIAVAEKGTEAAAATAVVIAEPTSAPVQPPLAIRADRPFLFFIRDDASGAILFMGRVADPSR